jgi:hypothetical protein
MAARRPSKWLAPIHFTQGSARLAEDGRFLGGGFRLNAAGDTVFGRRALEPRHPRFSQFYSKRADNLVQFSIEHDATAAFWRGGLDEDHSPVVTRHTQRSGRERFLVPGRKASGMPLTLSPVSPPPDSFGRERLRQFVAACDKLSASCRSYQAITVGKNSRMSPL